MRPLSCGDGGAATAPYRLVVVQLSACPIPPWAESSLGGLPHANVPYRPRCQISGRVYKPIEKSQEKLLQKKENN